MVVYNGISSRIKLSINAPNFLRHFIYSLFFAINGIYSTNDFKLRQNNKGIFFQILTVFLFF